MWIQTQDETLVNLDEVCAVRTYQQGVRGKFCVLAHTSVTTDANGSKNYTIAEFDDKALATELMKRVAFLLQVHKVIEEG